MKNAKELAHYTLSNQGEMREWWNWEYKYVEEVLNKWIKEVRIKSKKDNELVRDIVLCDLEGRNIIYNYMLALQKCRQDYTLDTITDAIDIVFQEMAEILSNHMRTEYPCLSHTHQVVIRVNKMQECVMYIGFYGMDSETACQLFGDGGVFMTQGFAACKQLFDSIGLFQ